MKTDIFEICIDLDSIGVSNLGTITGILYVKYGDILFPEKDWNDYVLIVLSTWASKFLALRENREEQVELRFMDGPYLVQMRNKNAGIAEMEFIEDAHIKKTEFACQIDLEKVGKSLRYTINKLLRECKNRKLISQDVVELENAFKSLS
jgi:hypothetical protein